MSSCKGSSLIEVLLYVLLSMMISIGTLYLTMQVYKASRDHMSRQDDLLQLGCALSCLVKDIHDASLEPFHLRSEAGDCLIFRRGEADCGWFVKKGRLMRYTGEYNPYTQSWAHRSVSMIAGSAASLSISYSYRKGVLVGVTCRLKSAHHQLEQFSATGSA